MLRIILTYGLVSGAVIILGMLGTMALNKGAPHDSNLWLGYLIMLVALSAVLVGIRQYRDRQGGGVISFRTGLVLGLGIAAAATVAYVVTWEIYLAMTHYAFMDQYAASTLEAKRAAGVTGAAYQKLVAEMDEMRRNYANPVFRWGMTAVEILPVGVAVAVVSALLLKNPRFLPARQAA